MTGNRDLSIDDAADQLRTLLTAFNLHCLGASFFHEAGSVANSFIGAQMV